MNTFDNMFFSLKLLTALGCALMAGLFFAFSVCVMKALAKLPAGEGMAAMQSINATILNPVFLMVFMGTTLACALTAILALVRWQQPGAAYLLAGSLLYLLGTFLVTVVFNVPMNDALAGLGRTDPHAAREWAGYLTNWTAWNHVRTVTSIAATAAVFLACSQPPAARAEAEDVSSVQGGAARPG
jgi:uncharacterized membrane protein